MTTETKRKRRATKEQREEAKKLLQVTNWTYAKIAEVTGVGESTIWNYAQEIREHASKKNKEFVGEVTIPVTKKQAELELDEEFDDRIAETTIEEPVNTVELPEVDEELPVIRRNFTMAVGSGDIHIADMTVAIQDVIDNLTKLGAKQVSFDLVVASPKE